MVLGNFVRLQEAVPKRLQFSKLYLTEREIKDPVSLEVKKIRVLEGRVIREDGMQVDKVFSITSEKLATMLREYMNDPQLSQKTFVITKYRTGYLTEYSLQVI